MCTHRFRFRLDADAEQSKRRVGQMREKEGRTYESNREYKVSS